MKVPQQLARHAADRLLQGPGMAAPPAGRRRTSPPPAISWSRELRETEKVPIGAIDDSWGGTPIRAWMSEAALRAAGGARARRYHRPVPQGPDGRASPFRRSWGEWWRSKTGDKPGQEPWHASDRLQWKPVPSLDLLGHLGAGVAKLRRRDLGARSGDADARGRRPRAATLSLSAIDDMDETFVNGIAVGGENAYDDPRKYALAQGRAHARRQRDHGLCSRFWRPRRLRRTARRVQADLRRRRRGAARERLAIFDDRQRRGQPAAGAAIGTGCRASRPSTTPWSRRSARSALKGVAWYQGEADVGTARL